jgi:predicted small lipoprotein YifL
MMMKTIQRSFALLAVVALVACGDKGDEGREIELAPSDSLAALNDTAPSTSPAPAPATPAPAATRPAPVAPRVTTRTGALSAGATMSLVSGPRVCTNSHKVGDRFTATTTAELNATNNVNIPAGSEVTLEVVESARGQNGTDKVKLAFKPVAITVRGNTTPLVADVTRVATLSYHRVQSNATQAGKVAAGAAVGAIAGQVLGRDTKSTVAGAAVGAAAGGVVAAQTTDYEGCLAAGGAIQVTLTEALSVRGA